MKINYKDVEAFKIFRVTPYASESALGNFVTKNRLLSYKKEGLVKRIKYYDASTDRNETCYSLTVKGKKFASDKFGIRAQYTNDRRTALHDARVAEAYCSLTPEERETAMSEHNFRNVAEEVLERFVEQREYDRADELRDALVNGNYSASDIIYRNSSGKFCCMEVVTSNYSFSECQIKEDTSALIGAEYIQIHT